MSTVLIAVLIVHVIQIIGLLVRLGRSDYPKVKEDYAKDDVVTLVLAIALVAWIAISLS